MSEPIPGTRDQTPEDLRQLPSAPRPVFAAGEPVPGLNSWVLERKLGGGGFGEVWLAKHVWDAEQTPRAVKFCTDPAARHRLVTHERNVVVRVMKYAGKHTNIVPLLDCNLDGNIPWLMYEFVEGGTLAGLIGEWRKVPLPQRLDDVVRILHAIAGALATCHRFDPPLVHRDMKPHNVVMAGAIPRITDFGIGSVVLQPQDSATTNAHTAYAARIPTALQGAGTRLYAPAEQTLGSTPNPRDDVYALGIIAYQLVTADLTTGPGADATLELSDLKIPSELAALIIRSAALDPNRRPKDAAEWEMTLVALVEKARNQSNTEARSAIGSNPVLLPEPVAVPTAGLPVRTGPPPLPPPIPRGVPSDQSVVRPIRSEAQRDETPHSRSFIHLMWTTIFLTGLGLSAVGVIHVVAKEVRKWLFTSTERTDEHKTESPKADPPPPGTKPSDPKPGDPKPGETREIEIAGGVKMAFCWVPMGECQLGSPQAEQDYVTKTFFEGKRPSWLNDEVEPKRGTFKTQGFWMGKYEVTQAEWMAVMGHNPSFFDGKKGNEAKGVDTNRFPVENVSWTMICGADGKGGFLERVNAHGGIRKAFGKAGMLALPHEDAWEYACRGGLGNRQPFHSGDTLNGDEANFDGDAPYGATVKVKPLGRTCAVDYTNVGKYAKHPWGLMHMHGNACERCEKSLNPTSKMSVIRGGAWCYSGHHCRAAYRDFFGSDGASYDIGFRLIIRLD